MSQEVKSGEQGGHGTSCKEIRQVGNISSKTSCEWCQYGPWFHSVETRRPLCHILCHTLPFWDIKSSPVSHNSTVEHSSSSKKIRPNYAYRQHCSPNCHFCAIKWFTVQVTRVCRFPLMKILIVYWTATVNIHFVTCLHNSLGDRAVSIALQAQLCGFNSWTIMIL